MNVSMYAISTLRGVGRDLDTPLYTILIVIIIEAVTSIHNILNHFFFNIK